MAAMKPDAVGENIEAREELKRVDARIGRRQAGVRNVLVSHFHRDAPSSAARWRP